MLKEKTKGNSNSSCNLSLTSSSILSDGCHTLNQCNKFSLLLSQTPTTQNISELLSWGCMFAQDFNLCYHLYNTKAIHALNYSICLSFSSNVSSQLSNPGSYTSKAKYYLHNPDYLSMEVMPPTELAQNF